jgi:hypothetical protein
MTIFKTGKPPDDAREVIAMGDHMGVPILGARKAEPTAPRGQAARHVRQGKHGPNVGQELPAMTLPEYARKGIEG